MDAVFGNSVGFGYFLDQAIDVGQGKDGRIEMRCGDEGADAIKLGKAVQKALDQRGRHFVSGIFFLYHGALGIALMAWLKAR